MKKRAAHSFTGAGLVLILLARILAAQAPASVKTASIAQDNASDQGRVAGPGLAPTKDASKISSQQGPASGPQPAEPQAGKPHDSGFVIGNDDHLAIHVWKEPDVSRSLPVRSDGKISLPLAGELQAAGRTPLQLEKDIAEKLRSYISDPEVTVVVQEINSEKFNILGQVARPGSYPLTRVTTVLDAIAIAGGFRDFAKQKSVYILRQDASGGESRIPFNYKDVIKGKSPKQNIRLEPRDTIVVP